MINFPESTVFSQNDTETGVLIKFGNLTEGKDYVKNISLGNSSSQIVVTINYTSSYSQDYLTVKFSDVLLSKTVYTPD